MASKKNAQNNTESSWGYSLKVFFATFAAACLLAVLSQLVLAEMKIVFIGFLLLLAIIFIGIIFDIIGVATTVANPAPFHAKAARKLPGAKQALVLLNNSSKVANICNDVIGDICGTLSGAIGTALVVGMMVTGGREALWASVLMTGLVSALTVGGKALGKSIAINSADTVMWRVGQILAWRSLLSIRREKKENEAEDKKAEDKKTAPKE